MLTLYHKVLALANRKKVSQQFDSDRISLIRWTKILFQYVMNFADNKQYELWVILLHLIMLTGTNKSVLMHYSHSICTLNDELF